MTGWIISDHRVHEYVPVTTFISKNGPCVWSVGVASWRKRRIFCVPCVLCVLICVAMPRHIPCLLNCLTTFHPSWRNVVSSRRLDYPRLLFSSLLSHLYVLTHPSSPESQLIGCFLRRRLASGEAALFFWSHPSLTSHISGLRRLRPQALHLTGLAI